VDEGAATAHRHRAADRHWGILTFKSTTFPTPAAAFVEAIKVFFDPFYS